MGSSEFQQSLLSLFEKMLPQMREGNLQLVFHRGGGSLFWKTDAGCGFELALDPASWKAEMKDEDVARIIQFMRDADLGKRADANASGPLDVAGIIRAALAAVDAFGTTDIWYRGQPSHVMKLQPGTFRDEKMNMEESSLLVRFIAGARSRHPSCPADDDQAAWLALMQHYGLPTRLLDWSESVLVATYFAVEDERFDSEPGIVWILSPEKLNHLRLKLPRQICYIRSQSVQPLLANAFSRDAAHVDTVAAVSAPELDMRLLMQLGRFTIHGSPRPLEAYEDQREFLRTITIPAFVKPAMRAQLNCLGIRSSTLFPDLNALARDVRRGYGRSRPHGKPLAQDDAAEDTSAEVKPRDMAVNATSDMSASHEDRNARP